MDSSKLEVDDELAGIPMPFVLDQLKGASPSLLDSTSVLEVNNDARGSVPQTLFYRPGQFAFASPSLVLAFVDETSRKPFYCPTIGLLYALLSPKFSHLSKTRILGQDLSPSRPDSIELPVQRILVPDLDEDLLQLIHLFAHTRDSVQLFLNLLPRSPIITCLVNTLGDHGNELVEEVVKCERTTLVS